MSPSRSRRWLKVALWTGLVVLVLLAAVCLLVLPANSPFAPAFYRFAASRAERSVPGLQVEFRKAGLVGLMNAFSISGFECEAGDFATLKFDQLTVSYRVLPILRGRASLRKVTLRDVIVKIDTSKSFPGVASKDGEETRPPEKKPPTAATGRSRMDFPSVDASNVTISVSFVVATGAPPTELVFRDLRLVAGPGVAGTTLPIGFAVDCAATVDGGSSVVVRCKGGFAPKPGGLDAADVDIDLAINGICMKDLNGMLAHIAPFLVKTGTLDCHFDARCRDGRLAGLASVEAQDFSITRNQEGKGGVHLFQLSLGMWQTLVKDGKGKVKVDVDIGGRLLHPEIPIGPVLAAQLGTAGRKAATGVLSIVPIGIVQDIGEAWEKNVEDQARYDDVLKIARLDPKEQHFERARHYEKVVKSYKMAVEEYTAQVRGYPKEADLAVRSLAMMAEIQARQLKDPPGAVATLRRLVETYASHPDADDAMLRMIDISAESKDYSNADKLCTEFGEKFQGSGLAESVAERRRRIAKYVW